VEVRDAEVRDVEAEVEIVGPPLAVVEGDPLGKL
jgi:hypothetical protein